jgi:hypothetical protein
VSPIVDRDYVGVVECGGAPRLTPKAFDELVVLGVLVPKHLQCDVPVEDLVVGQVDLGHSPPAQEIAESIAVVD